MGDSNNINEINKSLNLLHDKQDSQTEIINEMKQDLTTQKVLLDVYTRQQEKITEQLSVVDKKLDEKLTEYNYQLKIHIQGVQELKNQNELIRSEIDQRDKEWGARLEVAEKPIKWIHMTGIVVKWIGAAATAIASIYGFLKLFGL